MAVRKRGDTRKTAAEAASSDGTQRAAPAPAPVFSARRIFVRVGVSVALLAALYVPAWWKSESVRTFASRDEVLAIKSETVQCSRDYVNDRRLFKDCAPQKCGRVVSDSVVTSDETDALLSLAKRGLALSHSDGGASILDLHSGSISLGKKFVNVYKLLEQKGTTLFSENDLKVYKQVKDKIRSLIGFQFGIRPDTLHLTHPTFFSEMTVRPAVTVHDEYWHVHVDKEQYGSFHYTSLLYLTDYNADFGGGRLVFVDGTRGNATVEPKKGRVLAFTSGSENPHFVEKVDKGIRYALTVSFSCDPSKAIRDPGRPRPAV
ncbi:2-oxoglutarate and iron-dependent oxygenase domain-containing protein 3 [Rhipicephalus sanguineus]|uniref:2-oxoglutarate and iron-dependent oxygenase domain-containing protein 3 n=1 Tax=Rhipicephalus sanguineus TaxID=34632 RepID=UPI0018939D07|nr:2-oxoglutarate and iron-dependent oxygenase domain-containing protein 3 [Rhipicephalus sanguineus]